MSAFGATNEGGVEGGVPPFEGGVEHGCAPHRVKRKRRDEAGSRSAHRRGRALVASTRGSRRGCARMRHGPMRQAESEGGGRGCCALRYVIQDAWSRRPAPCPPRPPDIAAVSPSVRPNWCTQGQIRSGGVIGAVANIAPAGIPEGIDPAAEVTRLDPETKSEALTHTDQADENEEGSTGLGHGVCARV